MASFYAWLGPIAAAHLVLLVGVVVWARRAPDVFSAVINGLAVADRPADAFGYF